MKTRLLQSIAIITILGVLMLNPLSAKTSFENDSAGESSAPGIFNTFVEKLLNLNSFENVYAQSVPSDSVNNVSVTPFPTQIVDYNTTQLPVLDETIEPTVAQTEIPDATITPEPTELPAPVETEEPIPATGNESAAFPSVDEFAAEVRSDGMQGIWIQDSIAYQFYYVDWGSVPGSLNTAGLASYEGYQAFFIHNHLGGSDLYNINPGTSVAVIRKDRIDWYQIDGAYRIAGTSSSGACGTYSAPFSDWDGGQTYSAMDILTTYYSNPFAIQTCLCYDGKTGIFILTGS